MTLLSEIQAAQLLLLKPFVQKQFLIRTPLELVQLFNPNYHQLWLFDSSDYGDSNDYVYLRLFPKCDLRRETQGDRGYVTTFSRTASRLATVRQALTVTVNQQQSFVFDIINRLAQISDTSSYSRHTPIKIIDFCTPEAVDNENTAYYDGELGTTRYGRIDIEKRPAIVRGFKVNYAVEAWEFKFSEVNLRI